MVHIVTNTLICLYGAPIPISSQRILSVENGSSGFKDSSNCELMTIIL